MTQAALDAVPPRLHRRQFLVGAHPLPLPGWREVQLGGGLVLSHCPALPVASATDASGRRWWLLGLAVGTDPGRPDPPDAIRRSESAAVEAASESWAGRWILIGDGRILTDAGALLGCFWRATADGTSPRMSASSSPSLLAAAGGVRPRAVAGPLEHARGIDWYPPPGSRLAGVERLLPTQALDLTGVGDRVVPRRSWTRRPPADASYADLLSALETRLLEGCRRAAAQAGRTPWLPLTGGYDSRLLLAAARAAGLPLVAYTFDKPFTTMSPGDRSLPPVLAGKAGVEHRWIRPANDSEALALAFDRHTGGHCVDVDRFYLRTGQWDAVPPSALVLRGGVFEVGRCYYHRKLPARIPDDPREAARLIARRFGLAETGRDASAPRRGLEAWLEWAGRCPVPGVDWRDRFYLEQRVAGWLSSLEQGLDLTFPERFHAANSVDVARLLLALPEDVRRRSAHHVDLIGRLAPELLDVPFNPQTRRPLPRRLAGKVRRVLGRS